MKNSRRSDGDKVPLIPGLNLVFFVKGGKGGGRGESGRSGFVAPR